MADIKDKGNPFTRVLRYLYLRFIRLRGSPEDVARGMALGVFIGITPTMGVQMPLAFFFAMLLKENKMAAIIGVWISNPMTAIPIYTYNFKIGKYLLGTPDLRMPDFSSIHDVLALGYDFLAPLLLGSVVAGIFSAAVAYVITLRAYALVQLEREKIAELRKKRAAKKRKRIEGENN